MQTQNPTGQSRAEALGLREALGCAPASWDYDTGEMLGLGAKGSRLSLLRLGKACAQYTFCLQAGTPVHHAGRLLRHVALGRIAECGVAGESKQCLQFACWVNAATP